MRSPCFKSPYVAEGAVAAGAVLTELKRSTFFAEGASREGNQLGFSVIAMLEQA
jgi:hypothetical protein